MILLVPLVVAVPTIPIKTPVSGVLTLKNPLNVSLKVAVYMGYNVSSGSNLTPKELFRFKPSLYILKNWTPGSLVELPYTMNCSKPGNYTLNLNFKGLGMDGRIYRFHVSVPIRVLRNPIAVSSLTMYVQGTPLIGSVFNGQNVTVSFKLVNAVEVVVPTNVTLVVVKDSKALLRFNRSLAVFPGSKRLTFNFRVPWRWSVGSYKLIVLTVSKYGRTSIERDFQVSHGVSLVNVSLQSTSLFLGQNNTLYVTILFRRGLKVNVTVNGSVLKSLNLDVGSSLVRIPIAPKSTGRHFLKVSVLHDGVVLGSGEVSYTVLGLPRFLSVEGSASRSNVTLKVNLLNPNNVSVSVSLFVNVSGVGYHSPYVPLVLRPGPNSLSLTYGGVKPNSTVHYELKLLSSSLVLGYVYGMIRVPPAEHVNSTPVTSSTGSSATSTQGRAKRPVGGWRWAGGVTAAIMAVILFSTVLVSRRRRKGKEAYKSPWESARKPHVRRRWPSRRSPLGFFRKPSPPEVREGKELPKSGERKRTGEDRKKE